MMIMMKKEKKKQWKKWIASHWVIDNPEERAEKFHKDHPQQLIKYLNDVIYPLPFLHYVNHQNSIIDSEN